MPYKTVEVLGQIHIVKTVPTRGQGIREPNYKNTGMALCGILKPGQDLGNFIAETKNRPK